ncbi:MAG: 1,4-dihydroxy-2-naphthoate polyprenyltransferase [Candidatus Hydrogenedentota bacterium]
MKHWILAMRPKTLWAGACPVILGTAMAYSAESVHLPSAFAALLGALLIQIGTNFANDYYDGLKGTDSDDRKGPPRAVASGLITPAAMKRAMIIAMLLVFLPGAYIMWRGGVPFLIIGLVSIASGIAYTGGPYPLAYNGLGDFFALVFFGPVAVGGTYYLQTYDIPPEVIVAGIAPGLFSVAILTVNNLRDIEGDARANKRTLPARFGAGFGRAEYVASLFIATILIPAGLCTNLRDHYPSLAGGLVFLVAIPAYKTVFTKTDGPSLNAVLGNTGEYLLLFTILFSIGWIL